MNLAGPQALPNCGSAWTAFHGFVSMMVYPLSLHSFAFAGVTTTLYVAQNKFATATICLIATSFGTSMMWGRKFEINKQSADNADNQNQNASNGFFSMKNQPCRESSRVLGR